MHIAITNPYVWPHVRRGSERLLADLSHDLHARGHRVSVYAMAPEAGEENREGVAYHLMRQRLGLRPRQFNRLHDFALRLPTLLRDSDADAVFCLNYFDAYAALRARKRYKKSWKVVFMAVGIPTRAYFRAVPLDAWFMRTVLREADAVLALSRFAGERLQTDFGVSATVLAPPVDTAQFAQPMACPWDDPAPRILFVGDVDEPRKGARVMCDAFARLRAQRPDARLVLAGRVSPPTQAALLARLPDADSRAAVEFTGLGQVGDLPALYQHAAVTVLPSVWEAFGLVLVESLAAGTPVVGARHGGIPDIIDTDAVGTLFDPGAFTDQSHNTDGLVAAVAQVLARGKTDAVRAACQSRAHAFSWAALGPRYAALLQALVGHSKEPRA